MKLHFEEFALDLSRRQLTREGEILHLTPKAFDLLALLVDQAPRVVPKTELHEKLWPDTFVSDATLVGVVKELRRAMADTAETRPIIRTAHSVGYAFCLPVETRMDPRSAAAHWLLVNDRGVALQPGENAIGRDPAAAVWLDSSSVSRRHARIIVDGAGARLQDLGSKNGTKIGGQKVTGEIPLREGDVIDIGEIRLRYRKSASGGTTETQMPTES